MMHSIFRSMSIGGKPHQEPETFDVAAAVTSFMWRRDSSGRPSKIFSACALDSQPTRSSLCLSASSSAYVSGL